MSARSLGIGAPVGKDVYELYMETESRPAILARIADVMGRNRVDILEAHVQVSGDKRAATMIFYAEMIGARVGVNGIIKEFKQLEFVRNVRVESKRLRYFESMMPTLKGGPEYRVFALGSKSWLMLVHSINLTLGTAGNAILHNAGVAAGRGVVERIRARLGKQQREVFLEIVRDHFRAAGFGSLEISEGDGRFDVVISNNITSELDEPIIDQFLVGVARGYIEEITSSNHRVEQLREEGKTTKFALLRGMGQEFE